MEGACGDSQGQYEQPVTAPSTTLARRPLNGQLVPTTQRSTYDSSGDHWAQFGEDSILDPLANGGIEENDNIEHLEERAAVAKRDAQSKRKQTPPFVQKLSRYAFSLLPVESSANLFATASSTSRKTQS